MTNEQREEIIKSLAYGMKPEDIADIEDVSVETVEQIYQDYADDVAYKKKFYAERDRS